jgi:FkbM family methyltransferase
MSLSGIARKLLPGSLKQQLRPYLSSDMRHISYSQDGEDLMIASLLNVNRHSHAGFFVDVGAHHPHSLSNTFFFYRLGWRGINIDAMPGSMKTFQRLRPRDLNIEAAVSNVPTPLVYYEFNHTGMNGFISDIDALKADVPQIAVLNTRTIQAKTLSEILSSHLPAGQKIDFLTVDVEGHDLPVLQSNDWNRFRPSVVVVEDLEEFDLGRAAHSKVSNFMREIGYLPICRLRFSTAFAEASMIVKDMLAVRVQRMT